MSHFAGIASEVEAVIGATQTAKLLAARGGTTINIPAKAKNSALAEIIGEPATKAMIDAFGSGELTLPMGAVRGRAAVRQAAMGMFSDGKSLTTVALKSGVHIRTASRWKESTNKPDEGPGPLFKKIFDID